MRPRALLVIENTSQEWLGNRSTFTNSKAARMIWEALGIPERTGFSQIGDHAHSEWRGSQQPEVTAYVQPFLLGIVAVDGGTIDTNVLRTDGGFTLDKARWIDWTVPVLLKPPTRPESRPTLWILLIPCHQQRPGRDRSARKECRGPRRGRRK